MGTYWGFYLSVVEVSKTSIPYGFLEQLDGTWFKDTPSIISESELIAQAEETRALLMVEANQKIAPLQATSDVGIATDE
ncbi:tail fiber assembly protein [Hafnia paralvei]|uniref:tail fiber assembly protein n=1 Tax=Hafnia paralvei TaxID=546367 RepID=UPI001FFF9861|nr:tail fiber assembly protein [Hafnia paralvei]MCK2182323.1 tail fiber assembly protein [Hafnia paralvei]